MWKEFRSFILRGNVIDLAVGVVIGAAFGNIVNAIVNGVINPLVSFIGTGDLASKSVCVGDTTVIKGGKVVHVACPHLFKYGQIISSIISFVLVALVVFFFVVKPVNRLMQVFKTEESVVKKTRKCPECLSSIPMGARRCAFCTAEVEPTVGTTT